MDEPHSFNVDICIGEFSAVRWAKGADQYLSDLIDVMEENHWDWSYHAFREWPGWSLEVGEDKNVGALSPAPTARLRVLQAAFARNALTDVNTAAPQKSELPVAPNMATPARPLLPSK